MGCGASSNRGPSVLPEGALANKADPRDAGTIARVRAIGNELGAAVQSITPDVAAILSAVPYAGASFKTIEVFCAKAAVLEHNEAAYEFVALQVQACTRILKRAGDAIINANSRGVRVNRKNFFTEDTMELLEQAVYRASVLLDGYDGYGGILRVLSIRRFQGEVNNVRERLKAALAALSSELPVVLILDRSPVPLSEDEKEQQRATLREELDAQMADFESRAVTADNSISEEMLYAQAQAAEVRTLLGPGVANADSEELVRQLYSALTNGREVLRQRLSEALGLTVDKAREYSELLLGLMEERAAAGVDDLVALKWNPAANATSVNLGPVRFNVDRSAVKRRKEDAKYVLPPVLGVPLCSNAQDVLRNWSAIDFKRARQCHGWLPRKAKASSHQCTNTAAGKPRFMVNAYGLPGVFFVCKEHIALFDEYEYGLFEFVSDPVVNMVQHRPTEPQKQQ